MQQEARRGSVLQSPTSGIKVQVRFGSSLKSSRRPSLACKPTKLGAEQPANYRYLTGHFSPRFKTKRSSKNLLSMLQQKPSLQCLGRPASCKKETRETKENQDILDSLRQDHKHHSCYRPWSPPAHMQSEVLFNNLLPEEEHAKFTTPTSPQTARQATRLMKH